MFTDRNLSVSLCYNLTYPNPAMRSFTELVDYEFTEPEKVSKMAARHPEFAYVTVKDNATCDGEDPIKPNKSYCLIIKNLNPSFIKECVAYAIAKHVSGLTSYLMEVTVKNT